MAALGTSLNITFFLPEMTGFTRDNWRIILESDHDPAKKREKVGKVMYVDINGGPSLWPDERIEAFLTKHRPPTTQLFGQEAYVFEYEQYKNIDVPISNFGNYATYFIFTSGTPQQGRSYLICERPDPESIVVADAEKGKIRSCELFVHDRQRDMRLHAYFPARQAPAWRDVDASLRTLLATWTDGIIPAEELRALRNRAIDGIVKTQFADYSVAPVTCIAGGKRLAIPANFIASSGGIAQKMCDAVGIAGTLTVNLLLPEMTGFTPDHQRKMLEDTYLAGKNRESMSRMMQVEINGKSDLQHSPGTTIEALLASRPASGELFGQKAHVFDSSQREWKELPIRSRSTGATYYVLAGGTPDQGRSYLICGRLKASAVPASMDGWAFGGCELFAYDRQRDLHLRARFDPVNGSDWQKIDARLRIMVASWSDAILRAE